ncbi:MAG: hypothetical protein HY042_11470, partial [Spirochaetia bacterium]|nr:hypothetical protein [Spirochaetia bacterium]
MNKKWMIGAAAVGGVLLLVVVGVLLFGGRGQKKGNENFHPENWDAPIPSAKADIEEAFSMFDSQEQPSYQELMQGLRNGRINFVWELWRLRRGCPEKMERLQCNMRILTYLKEKYPGMDGEKLAHLVRAYLKYEDVMLGYSWPEGISTKERYELMKKKRREALSSDEATLMFGMEESSMELGEKQAAFFKDTAGMPGDQRIKQY